MLKRVLATLSHNINASPFWSALHLVQDSLQVTFSVGHTAFKTFLLQALGAKSRDRLNLSSTVTLFICVKGINF